MLLCRGLYEKIYRSDSEHFACGWRSLRVRGIFSADSSVCGREKRRAVCEHLSYFVWRALLLFFVGQISSRAALFLWAVFVPCGKFVFVRYVGYFVSGLGAAVAVRRGAVRYLPVFNGLVPPPQSAERVCVSQRAVGFVGRVLSAFFA